MITIQWIQSKAQQWTPFVENRGRKIQTLTEPLQWRHCRSKDNPADAGARGLNVSQLKSNALRWTGPQWLMQRNIDGEKYSKL